MVSSSKNYLHTNNRLKIQQATTYIMLSLAQFLHCTEVAITYTSLACCDANTCAQELITLQMI